MGPQVWKAIGGIALATALGTAIVVRSVEVSGDPAPEEPSTPVPGEHVPGTLYDQGPGAIPYAQQSTEERAYIDRARATVEANQPTGSHEAFDRAVDQAVARAEAVIAERKLGLEGIQEQGVVP